MGASSLLQRPNVGKIISLLLFIGLFTIVPEIVRLFWPTLIDTFSGQTIYLIQIVSMNFLGIGGYNLFMYFVYRAKHPFFQQYRVHKKPWPWETHNQQWKKHLGETVKCVALNNFVYGPFFLVLDLKVRGFLFTYSMEDWPTIPTMLGQFVVIILAEDAFFYWAHRTFHHPKLYWIHKRHHEYNIPIAISALYAHPLEFVFCDSLAFLVGAVFLSYVAKIHLITLLVWHCFRILETCEVHCGYEWSWSQLSFLPWKLNVEKHDFHHSHNVGNFGSEFGFWDSLMGTSQAFATYHKSSEQAKLE